MNPAGVASNGRVIPLLPATERLKSIWLRDLKYPQDKKVIAKLSAAEFRAWIYGLDPREALILACYAADIQKIQKRIMGKAPKRKTRKKRK